MAFIANKRYNHLLQVILLRYLPFVPLGILGFVFLFYSRTGNFPGWIDWDQYLATVLITIITRWLFLSTDKWLDKHVAITGARIIVGWLFQFILLFAAVGLMVILYIFFSSGFTNSLSEILVDYREEAMKLIILSGASSLLYGVIYFSISSFNTYSKGEIEQLTLHRKQLELQLELLKSQLSPHYLFNSLNTISSLIYKDPDLAEEFIRRLARSYNYILTTNDRMSVTLNEEVEFVRSYHYLLKVRFENNISLEINIPDERMATVIPPLTLQMLVENAVKHNAISRDSPLAIRIWGEGEDSIIVSNTKATGSNERSSFKIGLENIKRRYSYLTQEGIRVIDSETFEVHLPLIKSEQ